MARRRRRKSRRACVRAGRGRIVCGTIVKGHKTRRRRRRRRTSLGRARRRRR